MPQNGFTLESDDLTWAKRRVRGITELIKAAPTPADGPIRARSLFPVALDVSDLTVSDALVSLRHAGMHRWQGTQVVAPKGATSPDAAVKGAERYAAAFMAREGATPLSLYAESVRNLTLYGIDYVPTHVRVIGLVRPTEKRLSNGQLAPEWRAFDPSLTRAMRQTATDAILHSRYDATATDKLPTKRDKLREAARPTFYPTKDSGSQVGYETATTWQTLSQATQGARHGASIVPTRPDGTVQAIAPTDGHAIAERIKRGEATIAHLVAWINASRPAQSTVDEIFVTLPTNYRRKLAKGLRVKST